MNFSSVKGITIPEGKVTKLAINGTTVWQAIKTYTITYNLTNCSSSNTATTITEGEAYSSTISCTSAYMLQQCRVTMGGTYITAFSQTGSRKGTISIASVTGDIVITALADN